MSGLPPRPSHLPPVPPAPPLSSRPPPPFDHPVAEDRERRVPGAYRRDSREFERERGFRGGDRDPRFDDRERDLREYEERTKRRRSPSPSTRRDSTYEPRQRFGDERDDMRSSRHESHHSSRVLPPDPDQLEYLLPHADWIAWFRAKHADQAQEDEEADRQAHQEGRIGLIRKTDARYEDYRKDFISRQLFGLFLYHKTSQWFIDRYSPAPELAEKRKEVKEKSRVGRADKFVEDLEGGAFDLLNYDWAEGMESDPNASSGLPPGAVMDDSRNDPSKPNLVEAPIPPNQLLLKGIVPQVSRAEIEEVCSKVDGFVSLSLGPPIEKKNFTRVGWVNFADGTDMQSALSAVDKFRLERSQQQLHASLNDSPFTARPKLAPEGACKPERIEKDLQQAIALARMLEDESGLELRGSEAIDRRITALRESDDDRDIYSIIKLHLDLYLTYLREAFHTCYYSAAISESPEELQRRSIRYYRKVLVPKKRVVPERKGGDDDDGHMDEEDELGRTRRRRSDADERDRSMSPPTMRSQLPANGFRGDRNQDLSSVLWTQELDSKIAVLLKGSAANPADVGGKDVDLEMARITEPHIKREDDSKYRCKACSKLFKAADFLRKHVPSKHPELVDEELEELTFFNNFALDPLHIVPPPGTPASVNGVLPIAPCYNNDPSQAPMGPWLQGLGASGYTPGFVGIGLSGPGGGGGVYNPAFRPILGMRGGRPGGGGRDLMGRMGIDPDAPTVMVDQTNLKPEGVQDDPRAKKGKVSYNDWDASVPEGELATELPY